MELKMKAVFHYGKDSSLYIRRFPEKRVNMIIGELRKYPIEELRRFKQSLIEQLGTFDAEKLLAV